ncbi:hypothetical protein OG782_37280 (plasmid) [Streptomyces sp. NBC_00876]|nr:hypothetical protein OG782_37280 [Streptomyces sp. NBC_00876]
MKHTTTTGSATTEPAPEAATPGTDPALTRPGSGRATAIMAALSAC